MTFDPNGTGLVHSGIFSLPYTEEQAKIILLAVPWEVTTSYGQGCSLGPATLLAASKQLDLFDAHYGEFYKQGIFMRPIDEDWLRQSEELKKISCKVKARLENGDPLTDTDRDIQKKINDTSLQLNQWVYEQTKAILLHNKIPGVIGGDHSSPFGIIKALKEKYSDLSILHIDAHHDLRQAYQGYTHSHASIMYNVIKDLQPTALVQLGIRDFCPEEADLAQSNPNIHCYYDSHVSLKLHQGESWAQIIKQALNHLSDHVYISFDIDGLSPDLCPHTGTPVPGGLSFQQTESLLYLLSQSPKKIVGFDLCEISPGKNRVELDCWDGNVGARILFKLAGATLSQHSETRY